MSRARVIVLVAALALLVPTQVGAQGAYPPGGSFFDDNDSNHEPNIEAIAARGITQGCVPEGTAYCPYLNVTREQLAAFLSRALMLTPVTPNFTDVDPSSTHAGAIGAIAAAGITAGCDPAGTRFCPYDPVSREQMASLLVAALELIPRNNGPFLDIGGVHLENINALAFEGITLGCNADGDLFCPKTVVTRAQMASFLARSLGLDRVALAPRLKMTGSSSAVGVSEFYVQEGWTYDLPYESGDQARLQTSEFRVFVDGVRVTNLVSVPTTNMDGTMVALDGYLITGLTFGPHTVRGVWMWGGDVAFTSEVAVNVSG